MILFSILRLNVSPLSVSCSCYLFCDPFNNCVVVICSHACLDRNASCGMNQVQLNRITVCARSVCSKNPSPVYKMWKSAQAVELEVEVFC